MFRSVNLWWALLLSLSSTMYLTSCRSDQAPRSQTLIVGGSLVSSESPAARSLVALVRAEKGVLRSFCSGTLIAPRLVLTAAHCIEGIEEPRSIQVFFGLQLGELNAPRRTVVAMQSFRKESARYYPNFDVAWLRLAEPAPSSFQPVEILRDPSQIELGTPLLLAGFGKSSTLCASGEPPCAGVAREVTSPLRRYVNSAHFRDLLLTGPSPEQGSCNGDSGGPAYVRIQDRWYLAGLLHGKNYLMNGPAILDLNRICESGVSTYTFAGAYASWLESSGGSRLPLDPNSNPLPPLTTPAELPLQPRLQDFLAYDNPDSDLWLTAEVLLAGFKEEGKIKENSDLDAIVTDPARAAEAMRSWESFAAKGVGVNLNNLKPYDQQLSDLRPLAFLSNLKSLELSDHRIVDTSPLGELRKLESLKLSNNYDLKTQHKIPWDLRFLSRLPQLKTLNLLANGESLNLKQVPWTSLSKLESLILSNNAGSLDLYAVPWDKLPRLKRLVITSSGLSDITPLAGAKSLEELNLRRNKISDISMLENLKNLRVLDVSQNKIEDFGPVVYLDRLETLLALGNPTSEPAPCPASASCVYTSQGF